MSTISEKLTRLNTYKTNIKAAILEKGESVADDMSKYAEAIQNIQTGGGGGDEVLVSLIDGSINSINIPSGTTKIADYAFYYRADLASVTIPSSVTSIGNNAFNGCSKLTSITIPSSVTSIGAGGFNGCSKLTSITIPSSVTSIGSYAFSGCTALTTVIINASTINNAAIFKNCTSLSYLEFGDNVTLLGAGTIVSSASSKWFYNTTTRADLVIDFGNTRTTIPTLGHKYCFDGINSSAVIVVPDDLYDDWIVATNWVTFASQIVKYSEYHA